MMPHDPDRGDIILLDLSPQAGTEMAGEHRIIVISERAFSVATGWVVGCPITTKIKGSPFKVQVPRGLRIVAAWSRQNRGRWITSPVMPASLRRHRWICS